jgi:MFS family permease
MTEGAAVDEAATERASGRPWLTPGVRGIGLASLLADVGHEIPTALLPGLLGAITAAPAAALGLVEGIADALSGITRFIGGALADDPRRRRSIAVGGYTATAILSALIGLATAVWQVALLRAGAWAARGLRVPARNALLADAVDRAAFGRAYGFERAMDNLGAVIGPLLALVLVSAIGLRAAILVGVVPGLAAAAAIVYAVRHLERPKERHTAPVRLVVRPLLKGALGRTLAAVALFEAGNMAATLLILRATDLLTPARGADAAATTAIALYTGYNLVATIGSYPAGRFADRFGARRVLGVGIAAFGVAYLAFALVGADVLLLGLAFALAGLAIGAVETAQSAAVATMAPEANRGSAFGLLAGIQSLGDLVASGMVGVIWAIAGAPLAFLLAGLLMAASVVTLVLGRVAGTPEPDPVT